MTLSVSVDDVKRRAMVVTDDYDTQISLLIGETVPVVEYMIDEEFIHSTDTGLRALLNLAALEIVCGSFLEQLGYAEGSCDSFGITGLSVNMVRPAVKAIVKPNTPIETGDIIGWKQKEWRVKKHWTYSFAGVDVHTLVILSEVV